MKYLLIIICSWVQSAYAQNVSFKEIRLHPNPKYFNVKGTTIIYPIILTNNKAVDKRINNAIKHEMLRKEDSISTRKALTEEISSGLINMSYEVTFRKYGILSMNIYSEECIGNCISGYNYFNFDLKTGEPISIRDILLSEKIDSFRNIVFEDKVKALNHYKEEEKDFSKTGIDSSTYNWAIEQVDDCIKTIQIETFLLGSHGIEIIDPCEFPRIIRWQEPDYTLKYSYKFIAPFLRRKFKLVLK